MSLYAPTLAKYPELMRRRSAVRTAIAVAVIVVAVAAIAYTVPNFIDLAEQGRENARDASRARYRYGGGFLPVAIIVLAVGAAIAAIVALFGAGTRVWVRRASGAVLRKRLEGYHSMSVEQFERLHDAFASGDPAAYTPLPDQVRRGNGVVFIWTADADRCGYVGLTWGSDAKTTRNAPLIRLDGEHFDRLEEALRRGLRRPVPRPASVAPPEPVPAASPEPAPAALEHDANAAAMSIIEAVRAMAPADRLGSVSVWGAFHGRPYDYLLRLLNARVGDRQDSVVLSFDHSHQVVINRPAGVRNGKWTSIEVVDAESIVWSWPRDDGTSYVREFVRDADGVVRSSAAGAPPVEVDTARSHSAMELHIW